MRRLIRTMAALAVVMTGLTFAVASQSPQKADAANSNKITICHRTAAVNNPYRRITVNKTAIADDITSETPPAGKRGHGQWSHNQWPSQLGTNVSNRPSPNVFNPAWETSYYQTATQKRWGDIIPLTLDNGSSHNAAAMGLNYTAEGLAIYNGATYNGVNYAGLCKRMSAGQFCQTLINEGGTLAQCQEELVEQNSDDDAAAKSACGGSFANCSLTTLTSVKATTGAVTCSNSTPTFTGTATTGTVLHNLTFEYGTDASLATSTTQVGTPGTATGTESFSATLSAPLSDGTYYYRAVATEPTNEGRLEGGIGSFSISSSGCTVLSTGTDPNLEPPAGGYTGRLKGRVWIDLNRNGVQDPNEPGIPGVPVSAQLSGGTGSGSTVSGVTDEDGNFDFPTVTPGTWTITSTLSSNKLSRTYDSTATLTDWIATAEVPINGVGEGYFAAAGSSRMTLTTISSPTCRQAESIEIKWAGVDNKFKTTDDVTFNSTVAKQESEISNLPWGSYNVTPICSDGTRLATQTVIVSKSTKVTTLSVELAPAALPATGNGVNMNVLFMAVAIIGTGFALIMPRRRARR